MVRYLDEIIGEMLARAKVGRCGRCNSAHATFKLCFQCHGEVVQNEGLTVEKLRELRRRMVAGELGILPENLQWSDFTRVVTPRST